MSSKFMHIFANGRVFFTLIMKIIVYHMCITFFIHPSANRYRLLCILDIEMNNIMKMGVQVFLQDPNFISCILRTGVTVSHGNFIFHFWGMFMLFSIMTLPIYIPTNSVYKGSLSFPFLHILSNTCFLTIW